MTIAGIETSPTTNSTTQSLVWIQLKSDTVVEMHLSSVCVNESYGDIHEPVGDAMSEEMQ